MNELSNDSCSVIIIMLCVSDTSAGFANFDAFASDRVSGGTGPVSMSAAASNVGGPSMSVGGAPAPVSADKYSAFAELESAFTAPTVTTAAAVNWDSSWANRNTQPSWAPATTGSVFGSGGPAPQSGLIYGGNVAPSAAPATGFTSATGKLIHYYVAFIVSVIIVMDALLKSFIPTSLLSRLFVIPIIMLMK